MATNGNLTSSSRLLWRAAAVLALSLCATAMFAVLTDEPHAATVVTFMPH